MLITSEKKSKKIHSKDEFELCYLRHQYLRRVKINPTENQMRPFFGIVLNLARHTYFMYQNLFRSVGFDLDDINSIGRAHLVSFLGLFELSIMPDKYAGFVVIHQNKKGRRPNVDDLENKNKASFTSFLKQRMEDLVRVCRQKGRNIKGLPTDEYYAFYSSSEPKSTIRKNFKRLLEEHEKWGFKKMDTASFKSIMRRAKKLRLLNLRKKPIEIGKLFTFAGSWYIAIPLDKQVLTMEDFAGADLDPYDNMHNKTPEEILLVEEKLDDFENKKLHFESQSDSEKENIVRKFVKQNKSNPLFREEVNLAKKFMNDLRK